MSKKIYTKKESFGITWEKLGILGILALLCVLEMGLPLSWRKIVVYVVLSVFVIYVTVCFVHASVLSNLYLTIPLLPLILAKKCAFVPEF